MIKPEVVDKVLGTGAYARWLKTLGTFTDEQTRAYKHEEWLSSPWAASLKKGLQADRAFAEKISDDYVAFLERVSSSGTANVREGESILNVFMLAISILACVNDVLQDILLLGIPLLMAVDSTHLDPKDCCPHLKGQIKQHEANGWWKRRRRVGRRRSWAGRTWGMRG